jgi:hypothetical protein
MELALKSSSDSRGSGRSIRTDARPLAVSFADLWFDTHEPQGDM